MSIQKNIVPNLQESLQEPRQMELEKTISEAILRSETERAYQSEMNTLSALQKPQALLEFMRENAIYFFIAALIFVSLAYLLTMKMRAVNFGADINLF